MEKRKCGTNGAFSKAKKKPFRRIAERLKETGKRITSRLLKLESDPPDILFKIMETKNTKLIEAAVDRDTAKMKKLIKKGACVNTMIELGKVSAPLIHYCAINDAYPQLSLLLENGADPYTRDARGMTALMHAAGHSSYNICCALIADMLTKGKDINATDNEGMTALMHAATHAENDVCALFLLHGAADPYAKAKDGRTAYIFAGNSMTRKAIARNALGPALASPFLEQMLGKQPVSFRANFLMCIGKG
jgi:hypothetical protein